MNPPDSQSVPPADPTSPRDFLAPQLDPSRGFKTATLIGAIRAGNETAASQLCSDHWRALDLLAGRLLRAIPAGFVRARLEAERDDLVQGTFTKMCLAIRESRLTYHGPGRLSGWLRATLSHLLKDRRDYWHKREAQPLAETQSTGHRPEVVAPGPGASTAALLHEKYHRVRTAVAALDDLQQIIVELHVFHGVSWADVVEGIKKETGQEFNEDAVRMRFKTIRKKLALVLDGLQ